MALPASEDTRTDYLVYVKREDVKSIRFINDTGATLTAGDFIIFHGFVGEVQETAIATAEFTLKIQEELIIQTSDLKSGSTFATLGQAVYFNQNTEEFDDVGDDGLEVGKLLQIKSSAGEIVFAKTIRTLPGSNVVGMLEIIVDADHTTPIDHDLGVPAFEIVDVIVRSTATNASATVLLSDSASGAITDAIVAAVDTTIVRAGTIDPTYNEISDGIVEVTTNGAADRAVVTLLVKFKGV